MACHCVLLCVSVISLCFSCIIFKTMHPFKVSKKTPEMYLFNELMSFFVCFNKCAVLASANVHHSIMNTVIKSHTEAHMSQKNILFTNTQQLLVPYDWIHYGWIYYQLSTLKIQDSQSQTIKKTNIQELKRHLGPEKTRNESEPAKTHQGSISTLPLSPGLTT